MSILPYQKLLDMYVIENAILSNSITVKVGDAVIINSSAPQFVTPNGTNTTGIILGTVLAIKNGPAAGNTYLQVNSYTTASNNQTVAQVSVDILPTADQTVYNATLDANAGTTTNSQYFGYFNMLSGTAGQLHEASYSASVEGQFLSYGLVPGTLNQVYGVWTKIAQA
jgi:hypothetical protein